MPNTWVGPAHYFYRTFKDYVLRYFMTDTEILFNNISNMKSDLEPEMIDFLQKNKIEINKVRWRRLVPDAVVNNFIIEITKNTKRDNIRSLCWKADQYKDYTDDEFFTIVIIPMEKITNNVFEMLLEKYDIILFTENYQTILLDVFKLEENFMEIFQKYKSYYSEQFGNKPRKFQKLISEHIERFGLLSQIQGFGLNDRHEMEQSVTEKHNSDIISQSLNLDLILKDIFPRIANRIKAEKFLLLLKEKKSLEAGKSIWSEIGATQSEYYDTILSKLKKPGLIRKDH